MWFFGEVLHLHNVTRKDMGSYLCMASNGVPPSVSSRVTLNVNFPPTVKVGSDSVGCTIGEEISLQCFVESSPKGVTFWTRKSWDGSDELLLDGQNFSLTTDQHQKSYKYILTLTIKRCSSTDMGMYKCISTNALGHRKGRTLLYSSETASTLPPEAVSITTPKVKGKHQQVTLMGQIMVCPFVFLAYAIPNYHDAIS